MKNFRWLHVTDLHWGSEDHINLWGSIEPLWFADIDKMQKKCGGPWDAVFFTGDLVNEGTPEEFTALTERLLALFEHLESKGSKPYLIVVPGNHDLRRPNPKSTGCKLMTKLWEQDEDTRNAILRKDTKSDAWKVIQEAFENYTSWYEQQVKTQFKVPSSMNPGLLPGEFAVTLKKDSLEIGVLGLNTAFLQLAGGDFEGKLDANAAQIVAACEMMHPEWVKKHDACLLLTHHPLNWLSSHGRGEFNSVIAPSGRFVLHLCGHQHKAGMKVEILGGVAEGRRFWCGNAVFGMEPYLDNQTKPITDRRHGYSTGSVDFSGQQPLLRIWPRRMDKKEDDVWGFNQDTFFHLEENESIKPIPFESSRKTKPPAKDTKSTISEPCKTKKSTESDTVPLKAEIKNVVKQNILTLLAKKKLKCLRSVLKQMCEVEKESENEAEKIVDTLLGMELVSAMIKLQQAVLECINNLKDEGNSINSIIPIWDDCVAILGWLVLTAVKEEWVTKATLNIALKRASLKLLLPVETEVGADIAVSSLNGLKPNLNLDHRKEVTSGTRIPTENWQIEDGWNMDTKLLNFKNTLWRYLARVQNPQTAAVPKTGLNEDLNTVLKSRRVVQKEKYYVVANLSGKSNLHLDEELCRRLVADIEQLDIYLLDSKGEDGIAIVAEPQLRAQIREFLLIKTTIEEG